jgi:hypothetical protein
MKIDWFKEEKKKEKKSFKKEKFDTDTKSLMKTALALPIVAGGILIGTKLLKDL